MPPKADLLVIPDDHPPVLQGTHLEPRVYGLAREVGWHIERPADEAQLVEWIGSADVVVNLRASVYFARAVLEQCPKLRLISIWAVGTDNVDLEACRDLGITVCNTPGYAATGVAEHAIALALAVTHQIAAGDRRIRGGGWQDARIAQLHGKTLGVIGVGPIGQRMIELGRALGMDAIAWTFHPSPERAASLGVELVPLEQLLERSDVVSIHLPITGESRHLLGATELAKMKPAAIIVNTGRGPVIDEAGYGAGTTGGQAWRGRAGRVHHRAAASRQPPLRHGERSDVSTCRSHEPGDQSGRVSHGPRQHRGLLGRYANPSGR